MTWPCRAVIRIREPMEELAPKVWPGMGALEPESGNSCLLHLGARTAGELVWMITSVGVDFELVDAGEELRGAFRTLARRCSRAGLDERG